MLDLPREDLTKRQDELEGLKESKPVASRPPFGCIDGRLIDFVAGDMTKIDGLPRNHFDLAYPDDILYQIQLQSGHLPRV